MLRQLLCLRLPLLRRLRLHRRCEAQLGHARLHAWRMTTISPFAFQMKSHETTHARCRLGTSLFGRTSYMGEEEWGRDGPAVPRHTIPGRTAQARRDAPRRESDRRIYLVSPECIA